MISADERDQALQVLRGVWSANATEPEELDEEFGEGKCCKTVKDLGFGAMSAHPADPTGGKEVDGELRAAWRSILDRDGKRRADATSIGDQVRR